MAKNELPLEEMSIDQLFMGMDIVTYEIPIYQRNYAWEEEEIKVLVQDIYDACEKDSNKCYYIGTLVSYKEGDNVYEVIDGQQRLTTIRILLGVLGIEPTGILAYRARKKSDETISAIPILKDWKDDISFPPAATDSGIKNGYKYAKTAVKDIVEKGTVKKEEFIKYFRNNVKIIRYTVPKDIDLNHYFEIMNSRGEQLEKHEIEKAKLMQQLKTDDERAVFSRVWESCAEMNTYVQQNLLDFDKTDVFGDKLNDFLPISFDDLVNKFKAKISNDNSLISKQSKISIEDIIKKENTGEWTQKDDNVRPKEPFQSIIDFANFLLIVLKVCKLKDKSFKCEDGKLDDKELIDQFDKYKMDDDAIKEFAFTLLKARFFLDNYIVHHSKEDDTKYNNPWRLEVWKKEANKAAPINLTNDTDVQEKLQQLLSMFEVSFTPKQRKNYLLYCLKYLLDESTNNQKIDVKQYSIFVEELANRYFNELYLEKSLLNDDNSPSSGGFDKAMLKNNELNRAPIKLENKTTFISIFGDGSIKSVGIPLFVFNYMDYRIWKKYKEEIRGKKLKENAGARKQFFEDLGCAGFSLDEFDQFYFSRTRKSLEHFYPQRMAKDSPSTVNCDQINCFGNYAMIGSEANSSGSDWRPTQKLARYLEDSRKINPISVASLKFRIMMQLCKDRDKWEFDEIKEHQEKMLDILFDKGVLSP